MRLLSLDKFEIIFEPLIGKKQVEKKVDTEMKVKNF